jgi:mono/diheme cytochrome c family protein
MQIFWNGALAAALLLASVVPLQNSSGEKFAAVALVPSALHQTRASPLDLEVGGDVAGVPSGETRYLTRDVLLALPQVSLVVKNDANFTGPAQVSGVMLDELVRHLAAAPASDMVVAICDDQYRANYPQDYIAAHHPLLVLKVNGQPPAGWPKDAEGHGQSMGPYMITHPKFLPNFKISPYGDEAQIPWGVVRIEFRDEKKVYGAIAPHGPHAEDESVQHGYWIARQNCFRCHNNGDDGGTKAGRPWLVLSAWATASPEYFASYVRDPQAKNPHAQMPGNPSYNDKIIEALTAYFQTFSSSPSSASSKPQEKP